MAFGLPIIATKVGGLEEALSNYEGAYFVEPMDVRGLVEALKSLYKDNPGRFSPPESLRWERIALRWIELIGELQALRLRYQS